MMQNWLTLLIMNYNEVIIPMQRHENDHSELIRLSEIVSFAEFLSVETVSVRNTEPVYPVTIGEKLVCYALHPLLTHEWSSSEVEQVADPLEDALHLLDTGVDRPDTWRSLFTANAALKAYLERPPYQKG